MNQFFFIYKQVKTCAFNHNWSTNQKNVVMVHSWQRDWFWSLKEIYDRPYPPSFRTDFVNTQFVKCQYPRYCIKMRWNSIWNAPILLSRRLRYKIRRTNKSLYLIRLIFHRFIGCRNLFSESISIKNYIDEALALWILCILRLSKAKFSELSNLSIWFK